MVDQRPCLARGLSREAAYSKVLPEIFELMEDEDITVRCGAVTALSSILDMLTPGLLPCGALGIRDVLVSCRLEQKSAGKAAIFTCSLC